MTIALRFSTRSDVGLVRANNQDSAFAGEQLLLVADGMGGHAGGDVASALCTASIAPLNNEKFTTSDMLERLGDAIERARIELVREARANLPLAGMGTTVTGLLLCENKLAMAHMGDSRGYLLRDGKLSQVTKDHTFVQHLVDTGKITADEAETHPQRSVVMRVLGDFELDLVPDLSIREARPGDRWLLCSDGLSGFVRFETIEQTLRDVADLELCSEYLIQLALRGGGSDNITCVVADVYDTEADHTPAVPVERTPIIATSVGSVAYGDNIPEALDATGIGAASAKLLRSAHERVEKVIADAITVKNGGTIAEPEPHTGSLEIASASALQDSSSSSSSTSAASPTEAAGSAAGVAAPINDDDDAPIQVVPEKSRARRVGRALVNTLLIMILVGAGGFGAYKWGTQQYFVGVHDGKIAIFNGFPQSVGPVHLSSTVEVSDLDPNDLEPFAANQVYATIRASSLDDARARVATLENDIAQAKAEQPTAPPTTEPTTEPAAEPSKDATEQPTEEPTETPKETKSSKSSSGN